MRKKIFSLLLGSAGLALGTIAFATTNLNETKVAKAYYSPGTHYEVSDTASELASYYSSISDSDTGTTLLSKLQSLNSTKRKKTMGYGTIGTDTGGAVIYTDYDLNNTAKDSNGQTYGTKVASFYTKTAATSWNREHMWPNSHGGNNVEGDILHTRPTISSENSSRGNSFYVEGKNSSSAGWDPYTAGYDAEVRGECARVILYCVVAYPSFTLSDADSHSTSNSNKDNMMGNMNTLIKWHFDYAPNVYEMNRNNGAEYLQGNRNPFVDHPEYVARIWSSFNTTVSNLCSSNSSKYSSWTPGNYCNYGENTPVTPNAGVTISNSSASVSVGGTTQLSATSSDSGTITWTTSNSSVASISSSSSASGASITVTGVAAGTATITAKRTISGTEYSKTCTVTVTKVVSSLSKGSTSPTKTTYTAGESFDPTGLTITATYSDSTQGNVTSSVVWTPDPLTAGTTSVTGTFGGQSIVISGLTVNAATEPEIIDSNSDLSVGDYVVLRTAAGVGVTGWNNNKDATVSETESEWKKFYVTSASSSGFTLKDETANNYIANPGSSNQFIYGSAATCSTDSSGHLICNSRYLCKNGTNYRFYSSISSYLPFFIYKVPGSSTVKTLSSISVSTAPTKTTYTAGECFDPTGLVITRTYSDSTSDTYTYANHTSEFTFSPTTSTALTTSNVSVSITYGGKSCNQAITVNAARTLSSISVSTAPTKTSYTAGEYFDPTGLVITRNYSDSTSDTYTYSGHTSEFTFSPSTSTALTTSDASVTITYGGKSCNQTITVTAAQKTLSSISVSGQKTSFTVDESFSFGGTVTAIFSDSSQNNVTSSATFTGYDMSTPGNQTVTVSYTYGSNTETTTYQITVTASGGGGETSTSDVTINFASGGNCTSTSGTFDGVSFTTAQSSGTNPPAYNTNSYELRMYTGSSGNGNTFTLTPDEGYTITDVVITASSESYRPTVKYNVDGGSDVTGSWSSVTMIISGISASTSFVFRNANTVNTQLRIKSVAVTLSSASGGTADPESITATVSKTYYVGETVSTSDITVKDNNNNTISGFTFANNGYQFTYSDAPSGGALANKTFTNAISYESLTCSLTVQVQRKNRDSSGEQDVDITYTDLPTTYQTGLEIYESATGIHFQAYNCANYSSKMQFRASGGYLQTTDALELVSITINNRESNTLTVYGSNTAGSFSTTITGTNDVYDLSGYSYFKIIRNASGAAYCSSITIRVSGLDTAVNLSNYIMYEDTNNQCTTKTTTAIGYFEGLSKAERSTFMTSNDYVISSARERFNAWLANQGKSISPSDGDYIVSGRININLLADTVNNTTNTIFIISIAAFSLVALGSYFVIRKKKKQ